jgi:hypothetical protein
MAHSFLEEAEKASAARNSDGHGSEFAQNLLSLFDRATFLSTRDGLQDFLESFFMVRRELDRHFECVDNPSSPSNLSKGRKTSSNGWRKIRQRFCNCCRSPWPMPMKSSTNTSNICRMRFRKFRCGMLPGVCEKIILIVDRAERLSNADSFSGSEHLFAKSVTVLVVAQK